MAMNKQAPGIPTRTKNDLPKARPPSPPQIVAAKARAAKKSQEDEEKEDDSLDFSVV